MQETGIALRTRHARSIRQGHRGSCRRWVLALCCALVTAAPALASPNEKTAPDTKSARSVLLGGVTWHGTQQDARRRAQRADPQRPIVWLRVLGDLKGAT